MSKMLSSKSKIKEIDKKLPNESPRMRNGLIKMHIKLGHDFSAKKNESKKCSSCKYGP